MKTISNETDHSAALKKIEQLWNAEPGSPQDHMLIDLVEAVEKWEEEHYPIEPPTPEAVAQFRKEQETPCEEQGGNVCS